ncbi:MAG: hypothetical protein EB127_26805 [Alphaproteobacteria bacterium]|nr:hypothetical protein [Alphaproteobacteria bacterium]
MFGGRTRKRKSKMECMEVMTPKYQNRKSPAYHAGKCAGQIKKGKDGDYVSKEGSNGVYKWVKVNTTRKISSKGKHYDIHDNGSRPFRVIVSDDGASSKKVAIYKDVNTGTFEETADYSKLVKKLTVKEVYVGKSTGNAAGADHGSREAKLFVGNSLLLHVSGNKYIHVGTSIYEFQMDDKVDKYFSMVGNNDVPYPVLLGTENVYFMLEGDHCYLPRDMLPADLTMAQWEDAYTYFYGWTNPIDGKRRTDKERKKENLEQHAKKMKGYRLIQKREF